ncbi:MAG: zinc ribbon domain-containing protein [Planctomycetota bacterium]
MHPDVRKLIEVQKVDQEVARYRKDLISLPEEQAKRESKLNNQRAVAESAAKALQDSEVEAQANEVSLMQVDEELKKLEARLNSVKNNAEYQATLLQIESVKGERGRLEEEGLNLIERIESLKASKEEQDVALRDQEGVFQEFLEESKKIRAEREAQVAKVEVGRDELLKDIPDAILSKYERLFDARGSMAVCPVEGGNCTGCYSSIEPNLLVRLQGETTVVNCSSCQRFLYLAQ